MKNLAYFFMSIILFLSVFFIISFDTSYAQEATKHYQGSNYEKKESTLANGTIKGTATIFLYDRMVDYSGNYVPYLVKDDKHSITFQSEQTSFVYDKKSCAITIFEPGRITHDSIPFIKSQSWSVHYAKVDTDDWTELKHRNLPCKTSVAENEKEYVIEGTRQNDNGIFTVVYKKPIGGPLETLASFTNLDKTKDNHKFGFTDTLNEVPNSINTNQITFFSDRLNPLSNVVSKNFRLDKGIDIPREAFSQKQIRFDKFQTQFFDSTILSSISDGKIKQELLFDKIEKSLELTLDVVQTNLVYDFSTESEKFWNLRLDNTGTKTHAYVDFKELPEVPLRPGETTSIDPFWDFGFGTRLAVGANAGADTSCGPGDTFSGQTIIRKRDWPRTSTPSCQVTGASFDISSLRSSPVIDSVSVATTINTSVSSPGNCDINPLSQSPSDYQNSADGAGFWNDVNTGPSYLDNNIFCTALGTLGVTLDPQAASDLQAAIQTTQEFNIGFAFDDMTRDGLTHTVNGINDVQLTVIYHYTPGPADIRLDAFTKTGYQEFFPAQDSNFRAYVENPDSFDAQNVRLIVYISDDFSYTSSIAYQLQGGSWVNTITDFCTQPSPSDPLDCDLGTVFANGITDVYITTNPSDTISGDITATGVVSADNDPDDSPLSNVDAVTLPTGVIPQADLSTKITYIDDDAVFPDQLVTINTRFKNSGPDRLAGVSGQLIIPNFMTLESGPTVLSSDSSVNCPLFGNIINCLHLGYMNPGDTTTIQIVLRTDSNDPTVTQLFPQSRIVTSSSYPYQETNSGDEGTYRILYFIPSTGADLKTSVFATTTHPGLGLVASSGSGSVGYALGQNVHFYVTMKNDGPEIAENVWLDVGQHPNWTVISADEPCNDPGWRLCRMGDIAAGEQITFRVSIKYLDEGFYGHTFHPIMDTPDPYTSNNAASKTVVFLYPEIAGIITVP